jgi:hypothetical protein
MEIVLGKERLKGKLKDQNLKERGGGVVPDGGAVAQ